MELLESLYTTINAKKDHNIPLHHNALQRYGCYFLFSQRGETEWKRNKKKLIEVVPRRVATEPPNWLIRVKESQPANRNQERATCLRCLREIKRFCYDQFRRNRWTSVSSFLKNRNKNETVKWEEWILLATVTWSLFFLFRSCGASSGLTSQANPARGRCSTLPWSDRRGQGHSGWLIAVKLTKISHARLSHFFRSYATSTRYSSDCHYSYYYYHYSLTWTVYISRQVEKHLIKLVRLFYAMIRVLYDIWAI